MAIFRTGLIGLSVVCAPFAAQAATASLKTLYSFSGGSDGSFLSGALVLGPKNSLIGTALGGGVNNDGTLFQLVPPAATGGAWSFSLLHSFQDGSDGATPTSLVNGKNGTILGITLYGGGYASCLLNGVAHGCGAIFQAAPPVAGATAWTVKTVYSFTGQADGFYPSGLAADANGNLIGFAQGGTGSCVTSTGTGSGCGTVFRLSPPAAGATQWSFTTLYSFADEADGMAPSGTPLIDAKTGIIYGMAASGGANSTVCAPQAGCGEVFSLTPPATGATAWTKTALLLSNGVSGTGALNGLSEDAAGNLYGLTNTGGRTTAACPEQASVGAAAGCGVAFELSPPASGATKWSLSSIWNFANGSDGAYPYYSGFTVKSGVYYAASGGDSHKTLGAVVGFTPPAAGATKWTETVLHAFTDGADGAQPVGNLLLRGGVFYGVTYGGFPGTGAHGTVYSLTP